MSNLPWRRNARNNRAKPARTPIAYDVPNRLRRQVVLTASLLSLLFLGGLLGYHLIEGWSFLDAGYMTVITLTTVGFGEVFPLSEAGRVFTIVLVLAGAGTVAYGLSNLVSLLLSDESRRIWQLRRRFRMIDQLEDHVIVCGYGRMGRHIAASLEQEQLPFVVVDLDESAARICERDGRLALVGNAANELVLQQAGVAKARSLIAAVNSDAENVFIVLTARGLRPDLQILARANFEESEPKLLRAGANRVMLPYAVSGQRMASLVTRPGVADFLDVVMHSPELELWLEEVTVAPGSALAGQSLGEINPRQEFGVTVLAIYPPGQPLVTYPDAPARLEGGARLIALGTREGLRQFAERAARPLPAD